MTDRTETSGSPDLPIPKSGVVTDHHKDIILSIPFVKNLGVELVNASNGHAELKLILTGEHMNGWNVGHGGATMTLLDVAMAIAGRSLHPDFNGVVTVEMKTSFMQPAGRPGAGLTAVGRVLQRTTTLCFCEGEVMEGARLVAKAMGTFKYVTKNANKVLAKTALAGRELNNNDG